MLVDGAIGITLNLKCGTVRGGYTGLGLNFHPIEHKLDGVSHHDH